MLERFSSLLPRLPAHRPSAVVKAAYEEKVNVRAGYMQRFVEKEAEGKRCVLLAFTDHDPGGLHINKFLRSNLEELARAVGWSPDNLIIERFGLDYDFIEREQLTWIDNEPF
jgi:hypothetical protein